MAIEKNQNPGGRIGATCLTALPIWPIWPNFEVNGLDWLQNGPQDFDFFQLPWVPNLHIT